MKTAEARNIKISKESRDSAERQIREQQKETRYDIRDFTIEYIIQKFQDGLLFIPDYQRRFIWPQSHKERFIESILLGLPVPMMFLADLDDGRLEIVDGAQRIQTLEEFRANDLLLKKLEILTEISGFRYHDLPESQQRKFDTKALRLVVLEDTTTSDRRQEIFNRINTGSVKAKPSEVRRGDFDSPLMQLIVSLSTDPMFVKNCPVSIELEKRREREELVLRFFAYSDRYQNFKHDVYKFLDSYLLEYRANFDQNRLETEFANTMNFVNRYFPAGFAKTKNSKSTPRVRFEAIAVGVNLALREEPNLTPGNLSWLDSEQFLHHTTTHASNSGPKLKGRIEFVRNMLLRG